MDTDHIYEHGDTVLDPAPETDRLLTNLFAFFVNMFSFFRNAFKKYFPSGE